MTAANRKTGRLRPPVKIILIAALFGVVLLGIAAACFLAYINPPEDDVDSFDYPPEFFAKPKKTVSTVRKTENVLLMPVHTCFGTWVRM